MIPVIIHHRGNQPYFRDVVRQALSYNERVILIGDDSNRNTPGTEHFLERELYTPEIEFFKNGYIHMHHNPSLETRCACMIRWLLIAEVAEKLDFPMLFACDSDVMLYTNVEESERALGEYGRGYGLACSIPVLQPEFRWCASGHVSYWRRDTLLMFNKFLEGAYSHPETLRKLRSKWDWHKRTNSPGGICDMTLLWLFVQNRRQVFGRRMCVDLCSPVGGTVFDHNFNVFDEYVMEGAVKGIKWQDDQPYGYHIRLKSWIQFNAIHFQGVAKRVIGGYFRPRRAG